MVKEKEINEKGIAVKIDGKEKKCLMCSNNKFEKQKSKMIDLYFKRDVMNYICSNCGYVHTFIL